MKRILIPAGGALLATGLLAAGLAGTASADSYVQSKEMASAAQAKDIVDFWTATNNAALKAAKESNNWETKDVTALRIQSKGGATTDTKPGSTGPITNSSTAKAQNVNIPRTLGKVFFVNSKGEARWCSATSIQSANKNLVATAGHCVYDTASNSDLMDKWVFVPGYYQGKTPYGIYVGKQAFTHYDFDVYEDYDRDYAFVTVYNGINVTGGTSRQVSFNDFKAWPGVKEAKKVEISKEEFHKGRLDPTSTEAYWVDWGTHSKKAGPGYPGAEVSKKEVSKAEYNAAGFGKGEGKRFGEPVVSNVTAHEYFAYKGPGERGKDRHGNYYIVQYFVQTWAVPGTEAKYYKTAFYVIDGAAKDNGKLGDKVGWQGVAWNQPVKKAVRVFGYPAAAHPDGLKNFTGVTPKNCYGTTTSKLVGDSAKKIEEHVALKCSMTEGADGGPWLLNYKNSSRQGYVNGVTSTFNDQDKNDRVDYISSPYFDGETHAVYQAAAASASGSIIIK